MRIMEHNIQFAGRWGDSSLSLDSESDICFLVINPENEFGARGMVIDAVDVLLENDPRKTAIGSINDLLKLELPKLVVIMAHNDNYDGKAPEDRGLMNFLYALFKSGKILNSVLLLFVCVDNPQRKTNYLDGQMVEKQPDILASGISELIASFGCKGVIRFNTSIIGIGVEKVLRKMLEDVSNHKFNR